MALEILRAFLQDKGLFRIREALLSQLVENFHQDIQSYPPTCDKSSPKKDTCTDQWVHSALESLLNQDIATIVVSTSSCVHGYV